MLQGCFRQPFPVRYLGPFLPSESPPPACGARPRRRRGMRACRGRPIAQVSTVREAITTVTTVSLSCLLFLFFCCFLKKNLNASRPSEHPPVRGENVKTFRWDHRLPRQNLFMAFIIPSVFLFIFNTSIVLLLLSLI